MNLQKPKNLYSTRHQTDTFLHHKDTLETYPKPPNRHVSLPKLGNQAFKKSDSEAGTRLLYPVMLKSLELRWSLIRKIYAIVSIQLLATIVVGTVAVSVQRVANFLSAPAPAWRSTSFSSSRLSSCCTHSEIYHLRRGTHESTPLRRPRRLSKPSNDPASSPSRRPRRLTRLRRPCSSRSIRSSSFLSLRSFIHTSPRFRSSTPPPRLCFSDLQICFQSYEVLPLYSQDLIPFLL
ncbi:hypothetical protein ACFX2G_024538 [Malus domestica]